MSATIYRDDLERVYALIEKPERWTQGASARRANDSITDASSDDACKWCVEGAFERVMQAPEQLYFGNLMALLGTTPHTFNDSHTHAEVLQLLKDAIARAPVREAEGKSEGAGRE